MYYVEIKTSYNVIKLSVDDPNDEQLLEILEQPYILEVKIEQRDDVAFVKKLKK